MRAGLTLLASTARLGPRPVGAEGRASQASDRTQGPAGRRTARRATGRVDPRRRRSETNRQACPVRCARMMRVTRPGVAAGGFVPPRRSARAVLERPARQRPVRCHARRVQPRRAPRPARPRRTSAAPTMPPDRRLAVSDHLRGCSDHREPAQRRPNHASPQGAQRRAPDRGWARRSQRPGTPDRHATKRPRAPTSRRARQAPLRVRS